MENYSYVVGIDLGITNTLACYYKNGRRKFLESVSAKKFNPTDVATEILKEVKKNFIKAVGCNRDEKIGAVITVPAYFNNNQRTETRKAGMAAGFEVIQILEEPMAAAIAAIHKEKMDKKIFVMNIDNKNFYLSVLEADEKNHVYNAIALDGDFQLGGDDFDSALVNKFVKIIEDESGRDFSSAETAGLENMEYQKIMDCLLKNAREAKKELSSVEETEILMEIFDYYEFYLNLSRSDFKEICKDIFDKIFTRTKNFLENENNNFKISDIGHVVLTGAACKIPSIDDEIEKFFGVAPEPQSDREKLIAIGAALVARAQNEPESVNDTENNLNQHAENFQIWEDKFKKIENSFNLLKENLFRREKEISEREQELNERENNLNAREDNLNAREKEISEREAKILNHENKLSERQENLSFWQSRMEKNMINVFDELSEDLEKLKQKLEQRGIK